MGTTLHTLAPNPARPRRRSGWDAASARAPARPPARAPRARRLAPVTTGPASGSRVARCRCSAGCPSEEAYPVNLHVLEKFFEQGGVVDLEAMRGAGVIPKRTRIVKILGSGDLKAKLQVKAHRFSKTAIAKLEAVGGSAEVLALPKAQAKAKSA